MLPKNQQRRVALACRVCAATFEYLKSGAGRLPGFCSEQCRATAKPFSRKTARCPGCGEQFRPRYSARGAYCSNACHLAALNGPRKLYESPSARMAAERHRRRARLRGSSSERFDAAEIFSRDGWVCGICHKQVDPALRAPDPMAASLDHVVPISRGGAHTRANTQCAHWICNSRKTDGRGARFQCAAA